MNRRLKFALCILIVFTFSYTMLYSYFFGGYVTKDVQRYVDCLLPGAGSINGTINTTRLHNIIRKHRRAKKKGKFKFLILIYTSHFFHEVWPGVGYALLPDYTHKKKCHYQNCHVTYDKDSIVVADGVIFHGVDLQGPDQFSAQCLRRVGQFRPQNQRWIYYMHESPEYTRSLVPYNGLFNWTMTYMRRSDIFMPYFHHRKLLPGEPRPTANHNYAKGKDGLVLWIVSHCGLLRDEYVKELEKYVDVTVYGRCGSLYKHNAGFCSQWVSECDRLISRFKFYLAFENCFCEDYVTEKYWDKGLLHGTIPIVMGAVYHPDLVIAGSYIDVNDFNSIKELADYITYLDKNDDAYNRYFHWRRQFKVFNGYDFLCQTCKVLNKNKNSPKKVYHHLSDYWSTTNTCRKYGDRIQKLHEHIGYSRYG